MRKGFTLIELLAVIVILAILALIVSPIISGVISDAKDAANKRSVEGIAKSAEYYNMKQAQLGQTVSDSNIYDELTFSGKAPDKAEVYVKNEKVAVAAVYDNKCYSKDYDSNEVKSAKLSESGICTIHGVETDESCFAYTLKGDIKYTYNFNDFKIDDKDKCTDFFAYDFDINDTEARKFCNGETIELDYIDDEGNEASEEYNLNTFKDLIKSIEKLDDSGELEEAQAKQLKENYSEMGINNFIKVIANSDNVYVTIDDYLCSFSNEDHGVFEPTGYNDMILDMHKTNPYNLSEDERIRDVVIPSKIKNFPVTEIGEEAFSSYDLTSIYIPNTVTTLGFGAFSSNDLISVVIPDSVTTISECAFFNNRLVSVVLPKHIERIESSLFQFNKIKSVIIPEGVTEIGTRAFDSNDIEELIIPNTVTTIEPAAFLGNNLKSITIPGSITIIPELAFTHNQLEKVVISEGVQVIDDSAFSSNNLTNITLPESITIIGEFAFDDNNLKSVIIPSNVTTIGDGAFMKFKDKYFSSNPDLTIITNKTGVAKDWGLIINSETGYYFVTGTVVNSVGNVTIN